MADCPKIAQYTAAEATELMKVTVEAGDNLEAWSVGSVQAFLMGEDSAPPQRVWKPEELARFDSHKLPCWVLRYGQASPHATMRLQKPADLAVIVVGSPNC